MEVSLTALNLVSPAFAFLLFHSSEYNLNSVHAPRFPPGMEHPIMSAEYPATQKSEPQTPADKTDAPHRTRRDSLTLLETDDFVCIRPDTVLSEAIEQMKKDEGGCAIVCDEAGSVVGIFTERDLLNKIVGLKIDMNSPVRDWMSAGVETLAPDASIGDAVRVMNEKGYRNIPLVKDNQLVGSISVFDVITYLAESYPKETMNLPPVPAQVMDTPEGG
jgi:CBS domain-containing protein